MTVRGRREEGWGDYEPFFGKARDDEERLYIRRS
jgi:hypothetical protein